MSRHNIVGSEAFQRAPFVYIRSVSGRRRISPVALVAGATVGVGALGAMGFLAFALIQMLGVS